MGARGYSLVNTTNDKAGPGMPISCSEIRLSRFTTNLVLFPVRMTSAAATAVFDKDLAEPPNTTAAQIQVKFHDVQWFKG